MIQITDTDSGRTIQIQPHEFCGYLIELWLDRGYYDSLSMLLFERIYSSYVHSSALVCPLPHHVVHEYIKWLLGEVPFIKFDTEFEDDLDVPDLPF